jgi:uncharacterized integral membrane protein (TIGR00698 family)
LSLQQLAGVGGLGLLIVVLTLAGSYLFTVWLGAQLGVDYKLCHLIGAGTSVCGASAVLAANTVTEGSDEDVAYAVGIVTVFGTLAMLSYPLLAGLAALTPRAYGLWAGASIHEVAQVVAAGFQQGPVSGEFATVSKLSRVMLLAPVVAILGLALAERKPGEGRRLFRVPVPGFVLGFVLLSVVNSCLPLPAVARPWLSTGTQFLLAVALGAMGLEADVAKLSRKGLKPLLLGAGAWVFIAGLSYALIWAVGY